MSADAAPRTHFSFEIQYPAASAASPAERADVMDTLGAALQRLLGTLDGAADVAVSDGHKGPEHKLVELTTTLDDGQVGQLLESFAAQHDLRVQALE